MSTCTQERKQKARHTSHISRADFLGIENVESGGCDGIGGGIQAVGLGQISWLVWIKYVPQVPQHHRSAEDHSGWVGLVCALDIFCDMSASWFKQCILLSKRFVNFYV